MTGKEVIVPIKQFKGALACVILFDDHSNNPYYLYINVNQVNLFILQIQNTGKHFRIGIERGQKKVLDIPKWFQVVETLPACYRKNDREKSDYPLYSSV